MHFHQRTNHYPGMFNLCNKKYLGRHLTQMQRLLPQEFDFFPRTYLLPHDHKQFIADAKAAAQRATNTYIVKPEDNSQGRGIFLVRDFHSIKPNEP